MTAPFPASRLRRTRMQGWSRRLVAETRLDVADLILPLFVQEGERKETPINALPGVSRLSIDMLLKKAAEATKLGIPAVALFPVTEAALKDEQGSEALNADNLVCRAIRTLKAELPELGVIADVALDPYTSHGHDGVLAPYGEIDNDATVELLCRQALTLAQAGCDVVAPSDMMDGRIGAIRAALEMEGFQNTLILAYTAKYASAFYGPFREAVGSASALKSAGKHSYQMDSANSDEALREAAQDIAEGADMLMVKPGLPYLDVLYRLAHSTSLPVFAYQVSGEYATLRNASALGMEWQALLMESLLCLKRAGSRAIFTYGAVEAARLLQGNSR